MLAHLSAIMIALGYPGVFVWMFVSACIPIPSEVVLPFAGSMIVTRNAFNLHALAFAGALGNLGGSLFAYWIGAWKGRAFFEKYGKYVLIHKRDLDSADRWFLRHGEATVFFTRMMPVIRALISFPAGMSRMPIVRFSIYTFVGGLIWCYILVFTGVKLGEHWDRIGGYFHKADYAIAGIIVVLAAIWIWRHLRPDAEPPVAQPAEVEAAKSKAES